MVVSPRETEALKSIDTINHSQIGGANGYVEQRCSRACQFESHWNIFYQSEVESCIIIPRSVMIDFQNTRKILYNQ